MLGALLHFFGPAELENDELVVIGGLIIGLVWFRFGFTDGAYELKTPLPAALSVEELDACFVVRDGNGQELAYTVTRVTGKNAQTEVTLYSSEVQP